MQRTELRIKGRSWLKGGFESLWESFSIVQVSHSYGLAFLPSYPVDLIFSPLQQMSNGEVRHPFSWIILRLREVEGGGLNHLGTHQILWIFFQNTFLLLFFNHVPGLRDVITSIKENFHFIVIIYIVVSPVILYLQFPVWVVELGLTFHSIQYPMEENYHLELRFFKWFQLFWKANCVTLIMKLNAPRERESPIFAKTATVNFKSNPCCQLWLPWKPNCILLFNKNVPIEE